MIEQINPPFDGSKACPGCNHEVRGLSALIHNFLTRCDIESASIREKKALVKIYDIREMTIPDPDLFDHPVVREMLAVGKALQDAVAGMSQDGLTIRWTPDVVETIQTLILRAAVVSDSYDAISDAHFADRRHASGNDNILREEKGMRWAGFVNPDRKNTQYDHWVRVVPEQGDLVHRVCGTHLQIHDHFKQAMQNDQSFYGKVFCPNCTVTAPLGQFKNNLIVIPAERAVPVKDM